MFCFFSREVKKVFESKKVVRLTLLSLVLLNLTLQVKAQDFLILCNSTNSLEYSKTALSDEGTYFLLQGLTAEMEWQQISYFSDLRFSSDAQVGYKSEQTWNCELGTCFRNEYFSFNRQSMSYFISIKSDTYINKELLLSKDCLFDFPNI